MARLNFCFVARSVRHLPVASPCESTLALYPTKYQVELFNWTLGRCQRLYNHLLAERRDVYAWFGVSLSRFDQTNDLPAYKQEHPEYQQIGSQVLQDVVKRVDKAYGNFFRRVREGAATAGFPRFRAWNRYRSFTYGPSAGWKLEDYQLRLTGIGLLDVRWSRAMQGWVKEVSIVRDIDEWHAVNAGLDLALRRSWC
jgi:putative transposase